VAVLERHFQSWVKVQEEVVAAVEVAQKSSSRIA
jgi:hypothetical protein